MDKTKLKKDISIFAKNLGITLALLGVATLICFIIQNNDEGSTNASLMIFTLAVFMISKHATSIFWGILASFVGVIAVNYVFTYPYLELNFTLTGYPLTFVTMLAVSLLTGAMTSQIKQQEHLRTETEKEKIRADLLRSVSHDIRTPLTSIVGSTSVLLDENCNLSEDQKRQLLKDIQDDSRWLIRSTENILSITRIGNEDAKVDKSPELPEELIESALRKFEKHYPNAPRVDVILPEDPVFVPVDAILVEQVITNILENAVIHGGKVTLITIRVLNFANGVQFIIENNGDPIPYDVLSTIFKGAMHGKETHTGNEKRNMGIGLSVCYAIIKAHGGAMNATSSDEGVAFSFTLPLDQEARQ